MFRWYVVNTYSGHENKVKHNLEHRVISLGQQRAVRNVVVPTESVSEMKDNQKVTVEKRTMPGYVLVNMELNEDSWGVVKGTPGVTGFVGASQEPVPLTQVEVDRLLHKTTSRRRRARAPSSRSASPSRSSPGRCRTSPARSPRSTTTPRSSRCWYQSFGRPGRVLASVSERREASIAGARKSATELIGVHAKMAPEEEYSESTRSSCRRTPGRRAPPRRSVLRWASTGSTSWSSARRSTRRRRAKPAP